ncbi:MAG TPA: DUF5615 family PIN-like protein [Gemmataceae bacterium]|jgi:hypothetical protein|nr:DUF5615 family PIN-like protein [Gemmataceae bacterium]
MSISLYMDENVQGPITNGLRLRGIDVLTVQEDGRSSAPDSEVLDRATELGRVLFSQDHDMLREAHGRQQRTESFHGVIYAHQMRVTVGQCVRDLELIAVAGNSGDLQDTVVHLPF